jgi:hypothetical protein
MAFSHQKANQAFVAVVHLRLARTKRNPGRIHHGNVIGHAAI